MVITFYMPLQSLYNLLVSIMQDKTDETNYKETHVR